jgi:putative ABC transport system permease protein
MMLESLILSAAGGIVGCLFVIWTSRLGESRQLNLTFDPWLYALALGIATIVGTLVSIVPALRSGRTDLSVALKAGGQSSASRSRHRLRNFLVSAQVGMATLLTITAVLFSSAFVKTLLAEVNFEAERLIAVEVKLDRKRYQKPEQVSTYAQRALQALQDMPGVERASVSSPGVGSNWQTSRRIEFLDKTREYPDKGTRLQQASRDTFASIGQRLLHGRYFSSGNEALNEVIVNHDFLRKFAPHRNPVGEQFRIGGIGKQVFTIVGVVENRSPKLEMRGEGVEIYISHRHPIFSSTRIGLLVETKADAGAFGLAVRETVNHLDSLQPIGPAILVTDIIEKNIRPMKVAATIMLGMAAFGLCMSLMGVYGVVAYAAIERTREMGIRMALGANRRRIIMTVMSEGTRLLLWGGIPATFVAVVAILQMPERSFPGVDLSSPIHYLIGIAAVAFVGILAALLPARKMTKLNPSQALRHE